MARQERIRIRLKAYDHRVLDQSSKNIVEPSATVNRPTAASETNTPQKTPECAHPMGRASAQATGN